MPDTELAKRLNYFADNYRKVPVVEACELAREAAAALSAARAEAMREAAEKVRNMQRHYEQYLQKYPDEQLTAVRAALCESLAKQLDALAAGQGGENG